MSKRASKKKEMNFAYDKEIFELNNKIIASTIGYEDNIDEEIKLKLKSRLFAS